MCTPRLPRPLLSAYTRVRNILEMGKMGSFSSRAERFTLLASRTIDLILCCVDGVRFLQVMTHEVCHMFGLKHCIWMQCLMNGSNHLEESDRRPPHLCPVCLRKLQVQYIATLQQSNITNLSDGAYYIMLQSVLHFDVLGRYSFLYKWMSGSFLKSKSTLKLKGYKTAYQYYCSSKPTSIGLQL